MLGVVNDLKGICSIQEGVFLLDADAALRQGFRHPRFVILEPILHGFQEMTVFGQERYLMSPFDLRNFQETHCDFQF